MNFSNILFAVVIIGLALFFLYKKGIIFANFKKISPEKAYNLIQKERKNVFILDVRTPQEVKIDGKIKGAVLIPLYELSKRINQVPKDKKVIVYCRSGNRSISASRFLSSLGYEVYNLNGGINAWKGKGFPVKYK